MNPQSHHLMRAITGPVILITVGVLFAFDRFTEFRFSQTWPVLLIVVGLLRLMGGGRRYRDNYYPPPPPPYGNTGTPQPPPPYDRPEGRP